LRKLVPIKDMLIHAEKQGYAVGAFNINDMAGIQSVVQAAEEERSPVIIQVYSGSVDHFGLDYAMAISETAARITDIPIALHLDHGRDLETVERCVRAGFSSIMMDGSRLSLEENIDITKKAVKIAHDAGISAEAELGKIGSGSDEVSEADRKKFMTDPEEARRFVEETKVDALAVAVGSAHGLYKFKPNLDFQRLDEIRKITDVRLVLHGGSDLPEDQIRRAIEMGITKVNVATDLSGAYSNALREVVSGSEGIIWPGRVLSAVRDAMKELVKYKIRLFGSSGKA
jgi:fructose-bisphosphate aldolase class II